MLEPILSGNKKNVEDLLEALQYLEQKLKDDVVLTEIEKKKMKKKFNVVESYS